MIEVLRAAGPEGGRFAWQSYEANAADVSANGDLLLSQVEVRGTLTPAGPAQQVERRPVVILARGLWREARPAGRPEPLVINPPELAASRS